MAKLRTKNMKAQFNDWAFLLAVNPAHRSANHSEPFRMTLEEPAGCRMPSEGRIPVRTRFITKGISDMKSMIAIEQEASMTSLDFLRNIINPARIEYGEPEVENRHFLSRIEDEIDDLGVAENFT